MVREFLSSLRSRLFLIVVAAVFPALGLILYTNLQQRPAAIVEAQADALTLAQLASRSQEQLVQAGRELLVALAHLPEVRGNDPAACNDLFATLQQQHPVYANLGVIKPNGDLFCSALPTSGPVNLAHRLYFQRALERRGFAIGDYQLGVVTQRMTVNLAYPVLDAAGEVQAVVYAAIDLGWFNQYAADAHLPAGSTLSVLEQGGTILAHYPDPARWVGKPIAHEQLLQAVLAASEGVTVAPGMDGQPVLYGFTPLGGGGQPAAYVLVGIPERIVLADADRVLNRNLVFLGLLTLLALAFTWLGADLFIMRQIQPLLRATERLGAGDLSARAGTRGGPSELTRLAGAFDEMAVVLEQRTIQLREAESRYRTLVERIPAIVYTALFGASGRWLYVSPQIEAILGFSQTEWMADADLWFKQIHPADRERHLADEALSQATGQPLKAEYRMVSRDGRIVWFRDEAVVVRDESGHPAFLQGVMLDITERKQAEEALQKANEELTRSIGVLRQRNHEISLLSEMGDLLQTCLSAEEAYAVIARSAQKLFPDQSGALYILSASRNLVEAVAVWGEVPPAERVFVPDECWALRRGRVHLAEQDGAGLRCRHLGGGEGGAWEGGLASLCIPLVAQSEALGLLHLRWGGSPLLPSAAPPATAGSAPHELPEAAHQMAETVAEHVALALANLRLRETLRSQSIRDPVTGLFNRRYMEETLEREVRRADRNRHAMGVIMCDLDHFKQFNDSFGHEAGDALLREFGALLRSDFRSTDIACRYGGEEFVVILPEASAEDTRQRAEYLREAARRLRVSYRGQQLGPVTLSLGVAAFPDHGATGEALVRAADAALYRAKVEGRDRVITATRRHL